VWFYQIFWILLSSIYHTGPYHEKEHWHNRLPTGLASRRCAARAPGAGRSATGPPSDALFQNRPRDLLYKWAGSEDLWERRIAILSTLHFIRRDDFEDTLNLARNLLHDTHDLIHKAVGWMLREAGKRDLATLVSFLDEHGRKMPRTMLRYAIERLPEPQRQAYLSRGK